MVALVAPDAAGSEGIEFVLMKCRFFLLRQALYCGSMSCCLIYSLHCLKVSNYAMVALAMWIHHRVLFDRVTSLYTCAT